MEMPRMRLRKSQRKESSIRLTAVLTMLRCRNQSHPASTNIPLNLVHIRPIHRYAPLRKHVERGRHVPLSFR
jgi:hypothetical protein